MNLLSQSPEDGSEEPCQRTLAGTSTRRARPRDRLRGAHLPPRPSNLARGSASLWHCCGEGRSLGCWRSVSASAGISGIIRYPICCPRPGCGPFLGFEVPATATAETTTASQGVRHCRVANDSGLFQHTELENMYVADGENKSGV